MRIVVIIPTYNEKATIVSLIRALEDEFKLILRHEMRVLVVDGHSPDGTAAAARLEAAAYGNIDLIVETEKRGLGAAYIAGMNYAIRELRADAFIEFDGDFQHDPKDVKRMVGEFDGGYDYVIGSRYVPDGSVPAAWSFGRKFLSKYGSWFIRFMLRLPVHDCTSGLKLTRVRGFAERLPLSEEKVLSRRHAYKVHLLYEMVRLGAKVKEIPIQFLERARGSSKSTLQDIVESLKVVGVLYIRRLFGK